jgi:hypothetical protein
MIYSLSDVFHFDNRFTFASYIESNFNPNFGFDYFCLQMFCSIKKKWKIIAAKFCWRTRCYNWKFCQIWGCTILHHNHNMPKKFLSICIKMKADYMGAKIVVTSYYFLGVPCLNFNHVIIMKDFHNIFA